MKTQVIMFGSLRRQQALSASLMINMAADNVLQLVDQFNDARTWLYPLSALSNAGTPLSSQWFELGIWWLRTQIIKEKAKSFLSYSNSYKSINFFGSDVKVVRLRMHLSDIESRRLATKETRQGVTTSVDPLVLKTSLRRPRGCSLVKYRTKDPFLWGVHSEPRSEGARKLQKDYSLHSAVFKHQT